MAQLSRAHGVVIPKRAEAGAAAGSAAAAGDGEGWGEDGDGEEDDDGSGGLGGPVFSRPVLPMDDSSREAKTASRSGRRSSRGISGEGEESDSGTEGGAGGAAVATTGHPLIDACRAGDVEVGPGTRFLFDSAGTLCANS